MDPIVHKVLRFDRFALDLTRGCLRTGEQEIDLRPKAFQLLTYLAANAGRLVPKQELIEAVWPNAVVSDESLEQSIRQLRRGLGDADHRLIKTVPRRGYLFDVAISASEGTAPTTPPATETSRAAEVALSGPPLPDRPSIAVLPFINLSGDPEQAYFADGIVEDIITELSRFGELFVIARNSSFQYKGKAVDVRQVGRELGVRYVLEGSVRREGRRVRIAVQLIDAETGIHRWAERYDRKLQDIFAVKDEVTCTVVAILAAHVNRAEADRTILKPPAAWEVYDFCVRARATIASYLSSLKRDDLLEARRMANEVLAIDPTYARAYVMLSLTDLIAWYTKLDDDYINPAALDRAHQAALRAIQLVPRLPQAHAQLSLVMTYRCEHDAALAALERARELNPNLVDWRFTAVLTLAGDAARAIEVGRTYARLDPFYPAFAMGYLGLAHYMAKDYAEAARLLRECVARSPDNPPVHGWLAATYAQMGNQDQARAHAAEVLRIQPGWTIAGSARHLAAFRHSKDAQHFFDGFRKAGLPER